MPTPFPGMDPYLEQPGLWSEVHQNLITAIQWYLTPIIQPRYRIAVERYVYLSDRLPDEIGRPDVMIIKEAAPAYTVAVPSHTTKQQPIVGELEMEYEVEIGFLKLIHVNSNEIVTVIEVLSPTNKNDWKGRRKYLSKRMKILRSETNLVEIDLLRDGEPLPMSLKVQSDYRVVVSRSWQRPRADFYLFSVRDPIPAISIPLRQGEDEPLLQLNAVLHEVYERGGFKLAIDYGKPPVPPLSAENTMWATKLTNL